MANKTVFPYIGTAYNDAQSEIYLTTDSRLHSTFDNKSLVFSCSGSCTTPPHDPACLITISNNSSYVGTEFNKYDLRGATIRVSYTYTRNAVGYMCSLWLMSDTDANVCVDTYGKQTKSGYIQKTLGNNDTSFTIKQTFGINTQTTIRTTITSILITKGGITTEILDVDNPAIIYPTMIEEISHPMYIGSNLNKSSLLSKLYVGDGSNVCHQIKKQYVGDTNNLAKLIYSYGESSFTSLIYYNSLYYSGIDSRDIFTVNYTDNHIVFTVNGCCNQVFEDTKPAIYIKFTQTGHYPVIAEHLVEVTYTSVRSGGSYYIDTFLCSDSETTYYAPVYNCTDRKLSIITGPTDNYFTFYMTFGQSVQTNCTLTITSITVDGTEILNTQVPYVSKT